MNLIDRYKWSPNDIKTLSITKDGYLKSLSYEQKICLCAILLAPLWIGGSATGRTWAYHVFQTVKSLFNHDTCCDTLQSDLYDEFYAK